MLEGQMVVYMNDVLAAMAVHSTYHLSVRSFVCFSSFLSAILAVIRFGLLLGRLSRSVHSLSGFVFSIRWLFATLLPLSN
jgi:hypothetical protein